MALKIVLTEKPETREGWLLAGIEYFRAWFIQESLKPIPENILVSVGFSKGGKKNTIGSCYRTSSDANGTNQIFIYPTIAEPVEVLATLLHECIHAADDCESGHGKEFSRMARALGLEGKMTSTRAGEALTERLKGVLEDLGEYPHSQLVVTGAGKAANPMIKLICPDDACPYQTETKTSLKPYWVRTTITQLDMGYPSCPCGTGMEQG